MAMGLADRLNTALDADSAHSLAQARWLALSHVPPADRVDRLLTLLTIYDLHTAPLHKLGSRARWAGHPAVATLKTRLEQEFITELNAATSALATDTLADDDAVKAIRSLAAKDRLPTVYRWVAKQASLDELRQFVAVEGGPDGGFDDLVALCQVGLSGAPKMEMARNYWDEMGNGSPSGVHTDLHQQMAAALHIPELARQCLPEPALARSALGGLLATNRWLQPEMVGALGLIELQAGPRVPARSRSVPPARAALAGRHVLRRPRRRRSPARQGLARAGHRAAGSASAGLGRAHRQGSRLAVGGQRRAV